jgi:molecular chaperone GrpE (heat shock protein)
MEIFTGPLIKDKEYELSNDEFEELEKYINSITSTSSKSSTSSKTSSSKDSTSKSSTSSKTSTSKSSKTSFNSLNFLSPTPTLYKNSVKSEETNFKNIIDDIFNETSSISTEYLPENIDKILENNYKIISSKSYVIDNSLEKQIQENKKKYKSSLIKSIFEGLDNLGKTLDKFDNLKKY